MSYSEKCQEPFLVEESSIIQLAPALENIANELPENATHHDHLVALLIVLLSESGFRTAITADLPSCDTRPCLNIPSNWKSQETGVYQINFRLYNVPDVECRLVAVPSGDTLIVNCFQHRNNRQTYSIAIQTLKYVNPYSSDLNGRFMNFKEVSHRFKNELATPMKVDILRHRGLPYPTLEGLPLELKIKIFKLLSPVTIMKVAECSKELYEVCKDRDLWRKQRRKAR